MPRSNSLRYVLTSESRIALYSRSVILVSPSHGQTSCSVIFLPRASVLDASLNSYFFHLGNHGSQQVQHQLYP